VTVSGATVRVMLPATAAPADVPGVTT
jgi:hypothetical protein